MHRSAILAESLQESVEPLIDRGAEKSLQRLVDRFSEREHLKGIAVYDSTGTAIAITPGLNPQLHTQPPAAVQASRGGSGYGAFTKSSEGALQIYAVPLHRNGQPLGTLVIFHDATYINDQISRM